MMKSSKDRYTLSNLKLASKIKILLSILFLGVFSINFFESLNYPNYFYSHFRIIPQEANLVFGFLIILYLYSNFRHRLTNKLLQISAGLLLISIIPALLTTSSQFTARFIKVASRYDWTIEQKQELVIGKLVYFLNFVKRTVRPDSLLAAPPESLPWHYTGSSQYIRAWLYPVTVETYYLDKIEPLSADYYLISSEANGAPEHLWPDFPLAAEKIIIYDWENDIGIEYPGLDWNPDDWKGKSVWGLILTQKI